MRFFGSAYTDIGMVKETNQDSLCLKIVESDIGEVALAIVCDGMGGLSKGELASAEVIHEFVQWFDLELPGWSNSFSLKSVETEWEGLIQELNQRILFYGRENGIQMGTTLTALFAVENQYMIAHVGDCRAYEIRDGVRLLTVDQTFVEMEVQKGRMSREEADRDKRKNVLLQCIGASSEVIPEYIYGQIRKETVFMLCSDGFRHTLGVDEIFQAFHPGTINSVKDVEPKARHMTEMVKSRGERDNISVMVLKAI